MNELNSNQRGIGIFPMPDARQAELRLKALKLRNAGASFRTIAQSIGVSVGTAHLWIRDELDTLSCDRREEAEMFRQKQLEQLASLQIKLWKRANDENHKRQDFAVERLLKVLDQEARLVGLYAPVKTELTGKDGGAVETSVTGVTPIEVLREAYTPDEALRVAASLTAKLQLLAETTRDVQLRKAKEAAEKHGTTELADPLRVSMLEGGNDE